MVLRYKDRKKRILQHREFWGGMVRDGEGYQRGFPVMNNGVDFNAGGSALGISTAVPLRKSLDPID